MLAEYLPRKFRLGFFYYGQILRVGPESNILSLPPGVFIVPVGFIRKAGFLRVGRRRILWPRDRPSRQDRSARSERPC